MSLSDIDLPSDIKEEASELILGLAPNKSRVKYQLAYDRYEKRKKIEDTTNEKVEINNSVEKPDRPLPLNRKLVEQFEFGFYEPNKIPIGRCTLRQILKLISNHQMDPELWNTAKIAIEYKLPEDTIRNIIKHFRIYQIFIPDKKSKAVFAGPAVPKNKFDTDVDRKFLNSRNDKD